MAGANIDTVRAIDITVGTAISNIINISLISITYAHLLNSIINYLSYYSYHPAIWKTEQQTKGVTSGLADQPAID